MRAARGSKPMRLFGEFRTRAWPAEPAVRAVLGAAFALDTLTALIVIAYGSSYLVQTLNAPPSYPAFALGLHGVTRLLVAAPAGWLVDNTGGSTAVMAAAALQAAGLSTMLLSGDALGYLVGVVPLAMGTTLGWLVVLRALGAAVRPDGRGLAGARLTMLSGAGIAAGFGIATLVAALDLPPLAFAVAVALSGGYALMLWRAPIAPARLPRAGRTRRGGPVTRIEVVAASLLLAHFAAMASITAIVGPFALGELHLTLLGTVITLGPTVVFATAGAMLAGRRSRQGSRLREGAPMYALGAASAASLAFMPSAPWFGLAALPLGWVVGATSPRASAMKIDVSRMGDAPGTVLGRLAIAEGIGAGGGPVLVGLVIAVAEVRAGLLAVAAAFAVAALLAVAGTRLVRL
jgi:hypothetical protein